MNTTYVILGGTVVVVGGALLYIRHKAAQETAPDKCKAFAGIVGDITGTAAGPAYGDANSIGNRAAYLACKIASGIPELKELGTALKRAAAGGSDCASIHAENIKRHGQPVEFVHPQFAAFLERERINGKPAICTNPGVLKYTDGFIPYWGHVAGEHNVYALSKQSSAWQRAHLLTGVPWDPATQTGDALTRRHTADMGTFPLTIATGKSPWWVRGQPKLCNAGDTIAVDNRSSGGGMPVCWAAGTPPPERRTNDPGGWADIFGLHTVPHHVPDVGNPANPHDHRG